MVKILKCVQKGKEIKVEVLGEEGYVQFPKDLRTPNKMFVVDDLEKMDTHWRVKGLIYELNPVGGKASLVKSTKSTEGEFIEFTENNDKEGEQWSFFVSTSDPLVNGLKAGIDRYNESGDDESYSYKSVNQATVDSLMKRKSKTSYMKEYNLCRIVNPLKDFNTELKDLSSDDLMNFLYKGQCFKILKK